MILRALTLAGGIAGAGIAAQGPGFTRAYVQQLEGAVLTLSSVAAEFDAAARAVGLDQDEALARFRGSALLERRRIDMTRNLARQEALGADLVKMRDAGPFMRLYLLLRSPDSEVTRATWRNFHPAAPRTRPEVLFAAIGFCAGFLFTRLILWLPTWPQRYRRRRALRA